MLLEDIFDLDLLQQMLDQGMVTQRSHNELPLSIINYTDKAVYAKAWNNCTLNARGIVFDQDYNVLARPFSKAFNYSEQMVDIDLDEWVSCTDKLDGSLIQSFIYEDRVMLSTRGSFHSEQADWANVWLYKEHRKSLEYFKLWRDWTFLFEVVGPQNKIVLDYDSGLVLLATRQIDSGHIIGPGSASAMLHWEGPETQIMPYNSLREVLAAPTRPGTEGYVVRTGDGRMVKIKEEDYVLLHKAIFGLNAKRVWASLAAGLTIEEICNGLPDEVHQFVKDTAAGLLQQYAAKESQLNIKFTALSDIEDRKEFAVRVAKDPDRAFLFSILDEKNIDQMLWKTLEPKEIKNAVLSQD